MADNSKVSDLTIVQRLSVYFRPRTLLNIFLDNDIRYFYSAAAVAFCFAILFTIVGNRESNIGIHGFPAILIWWFLLFYLSCLEGVQAAVVALIHVDKEVYRTSHPQTFEVATLCHRGNNLDKFIVGRQFLVVFVVFVINYCSSYDNEALNSNPLDVSGTFMTGFVKTGMVSALATIVVGQLISQVVASKCNIDYLNFRFHYYAILYICLFMEATGICHFVYLIQLALVNYKGTPEEKKKQVEDQGNQVLFWGRSLLSTVILALSLAVVIKSLFNGDTAFASLFPGAPNYLGFIIFVFLCSVVCSTEGLQVSLFKMQKMDREQIRTHPGANAVAEVAFAGTNLQGFLIGRQVLTALSMFMLSSICGVQADLMRATGEFTDVDGVMTPVMESYTIFGVPTAFSEGLLETGLLGALVLTIVGSLSGQVMASAFPLGFAGFPGMWIVLYLCLMVEFIGLTHIAWPMADAVQFLMGPLMCNDEHYTETTNKTSGEKPDPSLMLSPKSRWGGHKENVDLESGEPVSLSKLELELSVKTDM